MKSKQQKITIAALCVLLVALLLFLKFKRSSLVPSYAGISVPRVFERKIVEGKGAGYGPKHKIEFVFSAWVYSPAKLANHGAELIINKSEIRQGASDDSLLTKFVTGMKTGEKKEVIVPYNEARAMREISSVPNDAIVLLEIQAQSVTPMRSD